MFGVFTTNTYHRLAVCFTELKIIFHHCLIPIGIAVHSSVLPDLFIDNHLQTCRFDNIGNCFFDRIYRIKPDRLKEILLSWLKNSAEVSAKAGGFARQHESLTTIDSPLKLGTCKNTINQ